MPTRVLSHRQDDMNSNLIPDNLPECFGLLENTAAPEALEKLRCLSKQDLHQEHFFGWGLFLRNRFIHPPDSPIREKMACLPLHYSHHDSCGELMLEAFWAHLNGKKGPNAVLEILVERWEGLVEATRLISAPGELESALADLERDKPRLEDVLPLYQSP